MVGIYRTIGTMCQMVLYTVIIYLQHPVETKRSAADGRTGFGGGGAEEEECAQRLMLDRNMRTWLTPLVPLYWSHQVGGVL